MARLLRHTLALLLTSCSLPALAVNYTIPGNLPPGCTGSGASYTCPGGGSLAYNDTVTIASATPITITVTGNMATNNARINQGGSASNLTLIVNGTLTAEYQAVLNANVQATVINGTGSEVVFGGNVTASGAITLGYRTSVAGNLSGLSLSTGTEITFSGNVATTTGALSISNTSTVAGNVTSTSGAISLANSVRVAGTVSCSCAVTLADQARVTGSVSAASLTASGQAYLLGTVTTTGAVDMAYASTLTGAVTAGGSIRLRGNTQAPACLRSTSSQTITLEWADRANGGVCCGAIGSCSTACVVNNSGAAMPAVCAGAPAVAASRFNAFETTTASGSITGVIKTKISGTAYSLAVAAINTAGTGVATTFTGAVKVEVLDASNSAGALDSTTNCRSSWTVAGGTSSSTLTFASTDQGRKTVSLTVAEAFRDARIRVSYPATGTPTVVGCSTDNFAIRPSSFGSYTATDSNSSTAGTTRNLTNTTTTGVVHKAGQPFTVRATALNSASVTTANYTGSPSYVAAACTGSVCGSTLGTVVYNTAAATAGVISTTATYSEVGAFTLQLVDSTFAAVDAADSTTTERNITSSVLTIGRFIPDHFTIVDSVTAGYSGPRLKTFNNTSCTTRSFTYLGQPFGYTTAPQATVTAVNAAGGATANYAKFGNAAFAVAQSYAVGASAPGLTTITSAPTVTVGAGGTARLTGQASDTLTMTRPVNAPVTNFSANTPATAISLTWSVSESSELGTTGNESITTPAPLLYSPLLFDQGSGEFRYGQLKLGSAYGSEMIPLAVPLETQYWDGSNFVTNAADQCTTLPTSAVSLANFRGSLAACKTAPSGTSVAFANGRGLLRMLAPGSGFAGSVDMTLQVGNTITAGALRCSTFNGSTSAAVAASLPWLQSRLPGGTTYDQNPSARISFGQYRSPLIFQREMY